MVNLLKTAKEIIVDFKGESYAFGSGAIEKTGILTSMIGKKALVIGPVKESWFKPVLDSALKSLKNSGVEVLKLISGAKPNAPREDVYRIQGHILHQKPDVVVAIDSGSGIDACKAAAALATFGDIEAEIDPYFGVGQVTKLCESTGRKVLPVVAVMTAASSGAHLTKYSNITDVVSGQKKLIVDEAIVPPKAIFDYGVTLSQPMPLTLDGSLDGLSHCLEVYLGAKEETLQSVENICLCGIELVIGGLKALIENPQDMTARELVALGTDMGGIAIMVGGTSGPHLNSFSFVKYLTHGRACAMMNPYYTVFYAPAVEDRVRKVGELFKKHGYIEETLDGLISRDLGIAVAKGMINFSGSMGFPTNLSEVESFEKEALNKALEAAKDPQLESKLNNMPVPLTSDTVDKYMGSVLDAAWEGNLNKIINLQ
jgi:alcohol dehydrogenase class IV